MTGQEPVTYCLTKDQIIVIARTQSLLTTFIARGIFEWKGPTHNQIVNTISDLQLILDGKV